MLFTTIPCINFVQKSLRRNEFVQSYSGPKLQLLVTVVTQVFLVTVTLGFPLNRKDRYEDLTLEGSAGEIPPKRRQWLALCKTFRTMTQFEI